MKNHKFFFPLILLINDFVITVVAFILAFMIRVHYDGRPFTSTIHASTYIEVLLFAAPAWLIFFASLGLYQKTIYERRSQEWSRLALGVFNGVLLLIGIDFLLGHTLFPARLIAVYGFILSLSLLLLSRIIIRRIKLYLFKYEIGINRVLVVGSNKTAKYIISQISHTASTGQKVIAIIGRNRKTPYEVQFFSNLDQLKTSPNKLNIDTIIQTELYDNPARNSEIVNFAQSRHIQYKFVPADDEFLTANNKISLIGELPVISVHPTKLLSWGNVVKRVFDIVVSLIVLILASPLVLVSMIILKFQANKAKVLFGHKRVTRYGEERTIYKLRTFKPEFSGKDARASFSKLGREDLIKQLDSGKTQFTDDPRISKFGDFLRHSSIDELPQLWNVLKGDLSLVGPRAIVKSELENYQKIAPLRQEVRSGITGLAQVSGRSDLPFEQRLELDIYYVQNWSMWLDIVILFRTVSAVIRRNGAK